MERVTSLEYLREFSNNDVAFMKDMINIFIETIGDDLRVIEDGWQKNDFPLVKSIVHKMKPSYQFMGISELREDILRLESLAKEGKEKEEMKILIRKITEYTILAVKELEVDLQQLSLRRSVNTSPKLLSTYLILFLAVFISGVSASIFSSDRKLSPEDLN